MSIKRTKLSFEDNFVQVPNAWLRDQRLSRRARGLLAELMTHKVGWTISIDALVRSGPEGRDAIRTAVAELVTLGYLVRSQSRDGGKFAEAEYDLGEPTVDWKSDDGSTDDGKSAPKNTIIQEEQIQEHQNPPNPPTGGLEVVKPKRKRRSPVVVTPEIEARYALAYTAWPKHTERENGLTSFATVVAGRPVEHIDSLVDKIKLFADTYSKGGWPPQFVPALSVWLNQKRWADDLPLPYLDGKKSTRTERNLDFVAQLAREQQQQQMRQQQARVERMIER